jgi:3-oxoacyl-[acyl-carrier protein] reductase
VIQLDLQGKNVIVTGSARGIGRGIAFKLANARANVACVDLDNPAVKALTYQLAAHTDLQSTVEEIERRGLKAVLILADVTSSPDCQRMVREAVEQLRSVDVPVNNAGVIAVGLVADFSEEQWDRVMAVKRQRSFFQGSRPPNG